MTFRRKSVNLISNIPSLLGLCLITQITPAFFLEIHHRGSPYLAFKSVISICRHVNYGLLLQTPTPPAGRRRSSAATAPARCTYAATSAGRRTRAGAAARRRSFAPARQRSPGTRAARRSGPPTGPAVRLTDPAAGPVRRRSSATAAAAPRCTRAEAAAGVGWYPFLYLKKKIGISVGLTEM